MEHAILRKYFSHSKRVATLCFRMQFTHYNMKMYAEIECDELVLKKHSNLIMFTKNKLKIFKVQPAI